MEQTGDSDASNMMLAWFAFDQKSRRPGRGDTLMKPVGIGSSMGLDRLATWNEVDRAISVSSQGAFAPVDDYENLRLAYSDSGGIGWELSEDALWLAIIHEMPFSKSN